MHTLTKEQSAAARASVENVLEKARELVAARESGDESRIEDAEQDIRDSALSVELRSGWVQSADDMFAEEYLVLLGWGGPAFRITGSLNKHNEPETAVPQWQDWGIPWTDVDLEPEEEELVLVFLSCFCFGSE